MYAPTNETVRFITNYMNEAQPEALRDIAQLHLSAATSAHLCTFESETLTLEVVHNGTTTTLTLDWPAPLTCREDVREHLSDMQQQGMFARLHRTTGHHAQ